MLTVFVCGPEPEDIFTAVYEAWDSRLGHDRVALEIETENRQERLFAVYRRVERDEEKAEKVARSVFRKISPGAYHGIYQAALSFEEDRADAIYRFLIRGFRVGADVTAQLQDPAVCRVFELSRRVGRESHLFLEFARFAQWDNGLLFGRLAPKCNVLPVIAPHFDGRLPQENWILYDETRSRAAVHPAGGSWFLTDMAEGGWEDFLRRQEKEGDGPLPVSADQEAWEDLWRGFVKNIAIEARVNPALQRNLMPLWYRKHMTEHQPGRAPKGDKTP